MNHYTPKQRKSDGKWDYTRNNCAAGYCREYVELDPEWVPSASQRIEYKKTAYKHHTDGHDTKEEACECYKEYLLDHSLRLNLMMSDQHLKCQVCKEWTKKYAEVSNSIFVLCENHNNKETVSELLSVNESWSSY